MRPLTTLTLLLLAAPAFAQDRPPAYTFKGWTPGEYTVTLRIGDDGRLLSVDLPKPAGEYTVFPFPKPGGTPTPPEAPSNVTDASRAGYAMVPSDADPDGHRLGLAEGYKALSLGLRWGHIQADEAAGAEAAMLEHELGELLPQYRFWINACRLAINATAPDPQRDLTAAELAAGYDAVADGLSSAAVDWPGLFKRLMMLLDLLRKLGIVK